MIKKITYNTEAREALKRGIDALADAVGVTLGPKGRNVIIENNGHPVITKDGVSVAKEIFLKDAVENLGAQMIKEVSLNTNKQAGDGTTTATVLAQAILRLGFLKISEGADPISVKRELDTCLPLVVEKLNKLAVDVKGDYEKIYDIATVSTNGDVKLALLLSELLEQTNDDNILLDISKTSDTYTEFTKGMSFNSSYIDSWFINGDNRDCIYNEPSILVYNGKIESVKELMPLFDDAVSQSVPLIIIAEKVSHDILQTIIVNKKKGLNTVVLNAPGFGPGRQEALNDIAIYTGTEVLQPGSLSKVNLSALGRVKQIVVTEEKTLLKEGYGNETEIENRINDLTSVLESQDEFTRKHTEQRISKFKGGIGTIYIGANSELEYREKHDRVEDAINAIKAALTEGIISGGGTTLHNIANEFEEDSILYEAIKAPYLKIKSNAGETEFNPEKDYKIYLESGIIDPKKVTRVALENAVSVAGTILTTECVIVNE